MKYVKTFEEFINENSSFDYHINVIKDAEDYLALNGMESVGEIEAFANNYLNDREIRPDDEKLITSLEFFKNQLGEKPNPKSTKLGKYLVKNKLAESLNEGGMDELDALAQDSKDLKSFKKEALKEFPKFKGNKGTDEWLEDIYNMANESVNEDFKMKWVTESFNEPGFTPHKLKNSRLVMKTRDELYYMQSHQLEKLLDQVNKIKNKLQEKYNKEQEGHGRFKIMDSLSADLTYLRRYAKIINYFLGGS
tara:strand:- start:163 stop:912 length:750 start_codon:yes stop_codon:yes gene_type:complete